MSRIAITGIWHQGMVLSAALAAIGHDVVGVVAPDAVAQLTGGTPLLHEPGVGELLAAGVAAGKLRFTADPAAALHDAEFVYVSTDTPVDEEDRPVLGEVLALAEQAGMFAPRSAVLVVTAQVRVGATEELARLSGLRAAYVPEFLQLGVALETFLRADRVVVGADDPAVGDAVAELYAPLGRPILRVGVRTAEMSKHASNAFLATSVSFANELGDICESVDADVRAVAEILQLDRRIGPHSYLSAGLGFSGATLGRDLRVLQAVGADAGLPTPLTDAVLAVNTGRAARVAERLRHYLGGRLDGKRIGFLGLTYKAGTSTMRRAVSLAIAETLNSSGASVTGFDPLADADELPPSSPVRLVRDPLDAAREADALVYLTDWDGRAHVDVARLRAAMTGDVFLDTRGDFDGASMRQAGFSYRRFPSDVDDLRA